MTFRQYWLGIAKLKNVHKAFHLKWYKFKKFLTWQNFLLTEWLIDWLTNLLMPSDKHNSILAIATGLIFHCSTLLCPETISYSSSNTCIMVLPYLAFVLLCTPFLSPLPCRWRLAARALWLQCKTWVSAVLAGVLQTLFFAWNVT